MPHGILCTCVGTHMYVFMCMCECVLDFSTSHNLECILKQMVEMYINLKQSMQLMHVPQSSWHNAVLRTQLGKVCYYSITYYSYGFPSLDRFLALPLQIHGTKLTSLS